jgi:hypothetical protein
MQFIRLEIELSKRQCSRPNAPFYLSSIYPTHLLALLNILDHGPSSPHSSKLPRGI